MSRKEAYVVHTMDSQANSEADAGRPVKQQGDYGRGEELVEKSVAVNKNLLLCSVLY
ncbi:hypothetical protein KIN20_007795 [Parelaphostrongylus tenuis]|uniref:Uncharacterized protein n=1 Tax=Parelaphostrongylus tenuis TaxID=148309 RepID=A0AAD5MLW4_PARTN|nr:hypothetical protein KIN20_007795 [Parelaphostrongylus tenuis]